MTDVITLKGRNQPMWNYLLKTFVNVCGKCYKKQITFQYMENKLIEMEKQRMDRFLENEGEEQDTYFDLTELKEHLKTLPPNERHKVKDFERLRNLANGQDPNEGMSEIDMVIKELEKEERENKNCGCCKKEMTDIKVLLNNIFPAGICDGICNYNLHCSKCRDLNEKENDFRIIKSFTVSGNQILFFKTRMTPPIYRSNTNRTNVRQMKREIDVLLDTYKLKQEFKRDKLVLMAIKSFVKRK